MELLDIFTAKTYFWKPSSSADGRRRNEMKRIAEVKEFGTKNGFNVVENENGSISLTKNVNEDKIEIYFNYEESCKNVYKTFNIFKNGNKSNISTLKKI